MLGQRSVKEEKSFQPLSVDDKIQNAENKEIVLHRHLGNMVPIMFDSETAMPRYILGPHFYIFIPTWFISLGLLIFVLYTVATRASSWLIVLSFFSGINFLFFYAKTGLSLPGIASQPREPLVVDLRSQRYCVPCRIIREPGTKHCYYCDVCIYKMDHHCPWIGKCVGRDNLCLFYQFLLSVFFMMVCLIFTTVTANPVSSTLTS